MILKKVTKNLWATRITVPQLYHASRDLETLQSGITNDISQMMEQETPFYLLEEEMHFSSQQKQKPQKTQKPLNTISNKTINSIFSEYVYRE